MDLAVPEESKSHISELSKPLHAQTPEDVTLKNTVLKIIKLAIPSTIFNLSFFLLDAITFYYLGQLNNPLLLSALGFGLTWANAFGIAIYFGIAIGFGVLAAQSYGARNYRQLGLYYQRSVVVQLLFLALTSLIFLRTENLLTLIGYEDDLAKLVGTFVITSIPTFCCYAIFMSTAFFLMAQERYDVNAKISILAIFIHFLACKFFIISMDLKLIGASIAKGISTFSMLFLCYEYIRRYNSCPEAWFPWTKESLDDLSGFIKVVFSHGSCVYAEWMTYELLTILAGYLHDVNILAAHTAILNYVYIMFNVVYGVVVSASTCLGNAVGEGSVKMVKIYAKSGAIVAYAGVGTIVAFSAVFSRQIASFYIEHEAVVEIGTNLVLIYVFIMPAEISANMFGYFLRTIGHERYILHCYMISYYAVALSCSTFLSFVLDLSIYGIWFGLMAGIYFMAFFVLKKLISIDWDLEVKKVAQSVKQAETFELLNLN